VLWSRGAERGGENTRYFAIACREPPAFFLSRDPFSLRAGKVVFPLGFAWISVVYIQPLKKMEGESKRKIRIGR